jgi:hypothetical protein
MPVTAGVTAISTNQDLALRSDMKEAKMAGEVPGRTTLVYRRRG